MRQKPALRDGLAGNPKSGTSGWLPKASWGVAILMVGLMVYVFLQRTPIAIFAAVQSPTQEAVVPTQVPPPVALPDFHPGEVMQAVARLAVPHTVIPDRPKAKATQYTVEKGDSVFSISKDFNLKPESVLWANYEQLKDDPQTLSVGLALNIPPVDGVYYKWKGGDSIDSVASRYKVKPEAILTWPGNHLDMTAPKIETGTYVMVPGGKGEFRQWVVPTIPRGPAGVSLGFKTCDTSKSMGLGTGAFVWPSPSRGISGNDFWGGHLGLDIGAGLGQYIYAADTGVVVYAAAISGGYGNMVMIDHGNGYQTLYAHLSQINVGCGQSVTQGQVIALAGSTGNSTGPHLHFEVRYMGGFINPWTVLP